MTVAIIGHKPRKNNNYRSSKRNIFNRNFMLKCIDYVVPDKIKTMLKKKLEELPSKHKVTTHKTLQ